VVKGKGERRKLLVPLGRALRHRRRLRVGIVQMVYVFVAFGLGLIVPRIPVGFTVPTGRMVQSLLAIGVGMVPFIGLVYSLLFLVVQFGSTTFTPRLNLFRDAPIVWHAFSFFTAIIVFSFTAAFSTGGNDRVSGLVPIALMVFLLTALGLFRALQTSAFRSVQLAFVLTQVRRRGREVIEGVYPTAISDTMADEDSREPAVGRATDEDHLVVWEGDSTVLQAVDVPRLAAVAERAGAVVELAVAPG
jgi:uncharacterized membrane protein